MRPAALLGLLAVTAALGALVVGRAVVLPELTAQSALVDANLAKALSAPIHMRLAEVVLAAHLVLAAVAGKWLGARWPTTAALVLVGASGLQRFVVLPALYAAWSRADLIAARPVSAIATAQTLELQELLLVAVMVVLQCALLIGASQRLTASNPMRAAVPTEARPEAAAPQATPA